MTMNLTIKLFTGETKSLELRADATVGELKQRISQLFREPTYKLKLSTMNGQRVSIEDDSRSISSYGLRSGSVVMLLISNPPSSQVFVKNEKGQIKTYDVEANETVDQLQIKVYQKEGVPVDQQRLIFNGRQLERGMTLQEYGIISGSTIYLTLRLRGG